MGFQIDGEEWMPQTTAEHSLAWMEQINAILEENNVTDKDGNVIKLSQNFANALYLQILAGAERLSDNDKNLSRALDSFNVESCDDQQIENLMPIAAVTRNPGSYSTQVITVTADENFACRIPAGARLPFESVYFVVQTEVLVEAGESVNINTICDTVGPVVALPGEITAFDTQIANLASVTNPVSSVPGTAQETIESIRKRIILGDTIKYSVDGCKNALEGLTGITYARVYFNYNNTTPTTLPGNVELAPRTAYIVIYGDSDEIAETYANYMSAPTQNGDGSAGTESTFTLSVTADNDNACTVPSGSSVTYGDYTFETTEVLTVAAGETGTVTAECTVAGAVVVPEGAITAFDETIANVASVTNGVTTPGTDPTARRQTWYTASGQAIDILYDVASEQEVYVNVVLTAGADGSDQVVSQIKRDLVAASADWGIGAEVTSLLTSAPFVDCTYTEVAYTEVSLDGENWTNIITADCNVVPRIKSANITVDQL